MGGLYVLPNKVRFDIVMWIGLVVALTGCTTTESVLGNEPQLMFPKRELNQAKGLLGVIYSTKESGYSLRFSPRRGGPKQTAAELQERLHKIRESDGNIAFSIRICGKQGETLVRQDGIFDRQNQEFRYDVNKRELVEQPVMVSLKFLDWHDDRSVISFREVGSSPPTSEQFVISHAEKDFNMTLSARVLID